MSSGGLQIGSTVYYWSSQYHEPNRGVPEAITLWRVQAEKALRQGRELPEIPPGYSIKEAPDVFADNQPAGSEAAANGTIISADSLPEKSAATTSPLCESDLAVLKIWCGQANLALQQGKALPILPPGYELVFEPMKEWVEQTVQEAKESTANVRIVLRRIGSTE